jgi:hypothetical protein
MQQERNIPRANARATEMTHPTFERKEHAMSNAIDMTIFEAEVILPAQMSWGARGHGNTSGAYALMRAILEDAVLCIERGRRRHPRTRQLAAEAETWMRSDCRDWLYSFASICDVLEIDADALRVRLLSNGEHPAKGGYAARGAAELSTRSAAAARPLAQRGSTRGSVAVDAVRAPVQRSVRDRETGSSFGVRAAWSRVR